jgi:transcriptional regulator with PAS, ATPase and Fis domain
MTPQDATKRLSDAATPPDLPRALLLLYHDGAVTHVRLSPDTPIVIGRDPNANVILHDASLSRSHARVTFDGKHAVIIEDLGSTNGTILRGHNLDKPTAVPHGAEIYFGAVLGIVHIPFVQTPSRCLVDGAEQAVVEGDIVMNAPAMKRVLELIRSYAFAIAPVVIGGETGTGKEEIAKLIHRSGPRKDKPFVVLNCASIPPQLLESMLFGHEKGAFTGASFQAKGFFEEAHGGTLLLDEIAELSLPAQAALLRVLETKRIVRVGSVREVELDFRLIAATWRNLEAMCADGTFRGDLFHRIRVLTIDVPPLRERREDIPTIVGRFIQRANKANGRQVQGIDEDALQTLVGYDWPGNIRELRNWIERAVVVAQCNHIRLCDLPMHIDAKPQQAKPKPASLKRHIDAVQGEMIEEALRQTGDNKPAAAALLGVSLRTVQRHIKQRDLSTRSGG